VAEAAGRDGLSFEELQAQQQDKRKQQQEERLIQQHQQHNSGMGS